MKKIYLFLVLVFSVIFGADGIGGIDEGYGIAGNDEKDQLMELTKALQAQEGVTDISDLEGGGALQVQSLEGQLALLTFNEKHLVFFKDIGITKGFSTLEEYSVQDGYGAEGGFVDQMENPEEGDPDFRRAFAVMKYIRTLWKVSDVIGYTKTISNAEVKAVQAAMMRALRTTEKTLFFGDSSMIPQSFDGIIKTIKDEGTADHVRDLRGASINSSSLRDGAELVSGNFGEATDMYMSLATKTSIDQLLGTGTPNNVRLNQDQIRSGSGVLPLGHSIDEMRTSYGNFALKPDVFLNKENWDVPKIKDPSNPKSLIEGATSAKAPATPTFALVVNAPTVTGSLWSATAGDSGGAIAGTYEYRVCSVNQYGKSAAAVAQSAAVAANGAITINITSGGGSYAPTAYEIFRETTPGSGKMRYLTTVTAAAATYQDKNEELPGTAIAVLVDNTVNGEYRTMALSQLAPMHKVKYAKIAPYNWGACNFYITPKWYEPKRYVLYKNIGVEFKSSVSPLIDL
jgi:hypothetical protein